MSPEEAKKLAAGPLGEMMGKFPLRFAKAAFFGDLPSKDGTARINNGTVSLVDLGQGPLAITCSHVIEPFRERLREGRPSLFQIGNCRLNPISQLVCESQELDLAVIRLTEQQVKEITADGEIGSLFFKPVRWPPAPVQEGEFIAFGGFPGQWRTQTNFDALEFRSYSNGASGVTAVGQTYFVSQFEREYWVRSFGDKDAKHLSDLGGLSGGPAFIHRDLHFDFVGVIYQFSQDYELLYVRHSVQLNPDGQIKQ
jgi:hypothetical protein